VRSVDRRAKRLRRGTCSAAVFAAVVALGACQSHPPMQPLAEARPPAASSIAGGEAPTASDAEQPRSEPASPEAIEACYGRLAGSSCWIFTGAQPVNGDCAEIDGTSNLVCRPLTR
jgi:hypothetical protein